MGLFRQMERLAASPSNGDGSHEARISERVASITGDDIISPNQLASLHSAGAASSTHTVHYYESTGRSATPRILVADDSMTGTAGPVNPQSAPVSEKTLSHSLCARFDLLLKHAGLEFQKEALVRWTNSRLERRPIRLLKRHWEISRYLAKRKRPERRPPNVIKHPTPIPLPVVSSR